MASAWSTSARIAPQRTTREGIQREIERLARHQKQLVRLDQLLALGLSDRGVRSRAQRRRLFRIHRAVYATHPPPYSMPQMCLAATLACGPLAVISDWGAAAHLGLTESHPLTVEVISPTGAGRGLTRVRVHRRPLDRRDVWRKGGIPTTTAARTIVDLAPSAGLEGVEALIMAADSKGILNRARLEELAEEHRGRPGIKHVRALIADDPAELRSVNELRMFSICREFGVERPLANHRIDLGGRTFFADFCWPRLRLIVEADSWRWHGGKLATEHDADRDQLLSIAGWRVVHFTRDQIKHARAETGRRLVALTADSGH